MIRTPLTVLTGFLGAGKTTLLSQLVRRPELARTAVVVNEFGAVGLDHALIAGSSENIVLLDNGCLCCSVRGDLVQTLHDLLRDRAQGECLDFDRIVIETTGLADPTPILHTLMTEPLLSAFLRLDGIVTVIDSVHGMGQLSRHGESVKQAAVADRLVLSKTDLADPAELRALQLRLRQIAPGAVQIAVSHGDVDPAQLLGCGLFDPDKKHPDVAGWLQAEAHAEAGHGHGHDHEHGPDCGCGHAHAPQGRHDDGVRSFCLAFDRPLPWEGVAPWLQRLVAEQGDRLLRIKGVLEVDGLDRPLAIHAIQHLFHPPAELPGWEGLERGSRIVFVAKDLAPEAVLGAQRAAMPQGPAAQLL